MAPGDTLTCTVAVSDPARQIPVRGSATAQVENTDPEVISIAITPPSGRVGDTLGCDASAIDVDGGEPSLAYTWTNGTASLGTGPTWRITADDTAPGEAVTCTATGTDAHGGTGTASASAIVDNSAPGAPGVAIEPERPIEGLDDLVCVIMAEAIDADGEDVTYAFEWAVDGVAWTGATTTSYEGDTVPGAETIADEVWTCTAWALDALDIGTPGEGSVTIQRYNRAPVVDDLGLNASSARVGETLTCAGSAYDPDGDAFTLEYAWRNDTTGTDLVSGVAYTVTAADTTPGDVLTCTLTATDAAGWPGTASASASVLNSEPAAPRVAIDPGTPVEGEDDLICEIATESTDADEDAVDYAIAWEVDGVAYTSATTTTRVGDTVGASALTEGEEWACTVTPNDGRDDGEPGSDRVVVRAQGVVALAAGDNHSLALLSDGTVVAWGWNYHGQLGDGTTTDTTAPVEVSGLEDVVAIAAGSIHSLALLSDGTVWAWGDNQGGQLGDGTETERTTPVQVSALSGAVAIAGGYLHSAAVLADGTVWAWGYNNSGQLGDGTTTSATSPVEVSGITDAVTVASGRYHTIAVSSDGTTRAWGSNSYGQLGDGTNTRSSTPVELTALAAADSAEGGTYFSIALLDDGTVWNWGDNNYGQLGDGTTTRSESPIEVSAVSDATAVAAGSLHSVALQSDGTVWAWGWNSSGQLGDGTTTDRSTPDEVSGVVGAITVVSGFSHCLALLADGAVWGWGNNSSGELADGTTTDRSTPVEVVGLP